MISTGNMRICEQINNFNVILIFRDIQQKIMSISDVDVIIKEGGNYEKYFRERVLMRKN